MNYPFDYEWDMKAIRKEGIAYSYGNIDNKFIINGRVGHIDREKMFGWKSFIDWTKSTIAPTPHVFKVDLNSYHLLMNTSYQKKVEIKFPYDCFAIYNTALKRVVEDKENKLEIMFVLVSPLDRDGYRFVKGQMTNDKDLLDFIYILKEDTLSPVLSDEVAKELGVDKYNLDKYPDMFRKASKEAKFKLSITQIVGCFLGNFVNFLNCRDVRFIERRVSTPIRKNEGYVKVTNDVTTVCITGKLLKDRKSVV